MQDLVSNGSGSLLGALLTVLLDRPSLDADAHPHRSGAR
ncbi:glycopeptide antibiotics resistance protein [Rathayibacter agropyri]